MENSIVKKRVRFQEKPTVHLMCTWIYAYQSARRGLWEQAARDHERFRLRIEKIGMIITPMLVKLMELSNK